MKSKRPDMDSRMLKMASQLRQSELARDDYEAWQEEQDAAAWAAETGASEQVAFRLRLISREWYSQGRKV